MPIYNFLEYSDNYTKPSASLCQYCGDEPDDDDDITDSKSIQFKSSIRK